ncbi:MAG: tRNA uridine(34) 5-carboxymethylaminomethyl modification radical SAM/GNAT enzyme Elp3 [Candidatus Gracilibacteria bacterium]|nr:tRNA uridine(34) 5-carboxymethylaminomethyl modification radical SAM/GNAT enzyme Elp3 [Candidatus Gracilibacteria bacterium]
MGKIIDKKTQFDGKSDIINELVLAGLEGLKKKPEFSKDDFHKIKNKIYGKYKIDKPFQSIELIERYNELVEKGTIEENFVFQKILRKRGVRSLSGITVISLLTEEFPCPAKCVYCPTFEGLPKSYIPNEPAVMRAELNKFDPIMQIHNRLRALEVTGHKIEKNDIRIIGGTWSFYPAKYKEKFIREIYDAFNSYDEMKKHIEKTDLSSDRFAAFKIKEGYKAHRSKTLEEAKKLNETSRLRVIGMAIETRPDWITSKEIYDLRRFGVTRVEIGYQTTDDEINHLNKRGHGNKESILATKMLKDAGFKVVAHMMPNLIGTNPDMDRKSMKEIFDNQLYRPDELKIYPMMVTDKSELTQIWKDGGFTAYDDETLINLTADLEAMIPEYVRLNRTYRDIPATEILEGSIIANLRQIVEAKLEKEGIKVMDIRNRELKNKKNDPTKAIMHNYKYSASDGEENFLTFEDEEDRTIFSLLRLRLPSTNNSDTTKKIVESKSIESALIPDFHNYPYSKTLEEIHTFLPELKGASIIREIHTFGDQLSIGEKGGKFGQHVGFGKRLIEEAEKLSIEAGYKKIAVIAGEGVKQYYEKRGYSVEGFYMVKKLG